MSAASATASRPRSVRDTTWLRRPGAPLPGDVAVGFQPAEGLAHGLRLYAHQLGKLGAYRGSVDGEHFHSDDPGMVRPMASIFRSRSVQQGVLPWTIGCPVGQRSISGIPKEYSEHKIRRCHLRSLGWYFATLGPPGCPPCKEHNLSERLIPGDTAPAFTLRNAEGREVSSEISAAAAPSSTSIRAASTRGTKEACFRDFLSLQWLRGGGDFPDPRTSSPSSRPRKAPPPLLSDPDHTVAEAYGAWGEKKTMARPRKDRSVHGGHRPRRPVAVAQYNVRATGHVAKLRRDLKIDVQTFKFAAGDACRISGDRGQSEGTDLLRAAGVVIGSATLPFGMVAAAVLTYTAIAHHRGGARHHWRSHDRQRPRRLLVVVHISVDARCSNARADAPCPAKCTMEAGIRPRRSEDPTDDGRCARVVKLADTQDLGSCAFGRGGSNPPCATLMSPGLRTGAHSF